MSHSPTRERRAPRPLRSPHADRNRARASALVGLALATSVAAAVAVVTLVGYDHQPNLVHAVHGDASLTEFTRLSDREIGDAGRQVCAELARGRTSFELAKELSSTYALPGSSTTAFVRTAIEIECPELSDS